MTLKALLYIYVLGGLTFLPLVLAAILIPAWLLLPKVQDGGARGESGGKTDEQRKLDKKAEEEETAVGPPEAAAEATFAVLRSYDFPAANAALNARHTSGNTAGGVTGTTDGEVDGNETGGSSVYQSVYRSVFASGKSNTTGPSTSREVLENEDPTSGPDGRAKRKATPANVFYIVLRHGHLMLYDSASQMEVRHVISLAHHTLSLSEGLETDDEERRMRDGDLFIKRTAIVLTPTDLPNGGLQSRAAPPKPFYLFSTLCSEKEDFYHALLYTRANPPIPEPLEPNDIIKLQSTLHSTSLTPETRAFNALFGRIFLGIYHTPWLQNLIQSKIEKKISRVQKPSFLADLIVQSVDLGNAAPVLSKPMLKDINISGDMTVAFDVKYTGAINITVAATAKLDLGPRFKTRTVDLVLASSLQRLQGRMLVRIKPPPSNRIWFCFETPPDMDVKVEPVVSQRKISYTFILRAIEDRIRAVVTETLVKPNWDDIPFYNTIDQQVRGGIWRDEGGGTEPKAGEMLRERNAKTKSMPVLPPLPEHDSSAGSSGSETTSKIATGSNTPTNGMVSELKRRSVASLPARSATNMSTSSTYAASPEAGSSPGLPPTKPLRSPSLTSPSASQPSVALDESLANMDPSRGDGLQTQSRRWRMRQAAPPLPARKGAVDAVREMRDRVLVHREAAEAEATQADLLEGNANFVEEPSEEHSTGDEHAAEEDGRRSLDSPAPSLKSANRTDTMASTASSATSRSAQQQRKNLLAATAAATTAARNWSWNALANARTKGSSPIAPRASSTATSTTPQLQPMGRGQPLPPPGVPLPGPQKGLFAGLGTVRRKPVARTGSELPPSREGLGSRDGISSREGEKSDVDVTTAEVNDEDEEETRGVMSDEFGPWRQNSGLEMTDGVYKGDNAQSGEASASSAIPPSTHTEQSDSTADTALNGDEKVKPPLPPRRGVEAAAPNEQPISQKLTAPTASTGETTSNHDRANTATSSEDLLDLSDASASQPPTQAHDTDDGQDLPTVEPASNTVGADEAGEMSDDGSDEIVAIPAPIEDGEDLKASKVGGQEGELSHGVIS